MGLMRNVFQRDGTWWVRIDIPADVRDQWGKTSEWRSLKTADKLEAIAGAPAVIKDIKQRIQALRSGAEVLAEPAPAAPIPHPYG